MKHFFKSRLILASLGVLVAIVLTVSENDTRSFADLLITPVEARLGRPATPVSYAGVARRTTVRVATPGVGAPGVGANRGGPVNRVGVR